MGKQGEIPAHPKYVFQGIGEFVHNQKIMVLFTSLLLYLYLNYINSNGSRQCVFVKNAPLSIQNHEFQMFIKGKLR